MQQNRIAELRHIDGLNQKELGEKQGSWDDNIIVLMGKSDQSVTNNGNSGNNPKLTK